MARAVLCPVCEGSGHAQPPDYFTDMVDCHGCGGKGWVQVDDTPPRPYWPPPAPQQSPPPLHPCTAPPYSPQIWCC